ncbi:hypothetical protein CJ030_MR7G005486 [Morella rubra]|uniref:ATPase AAA-type core domain-containing protein n=1 Tax=Morella rubra TaxID=262757 RepID=A0A6A1V728_9ROSI|nr:hypothetical protein CJ030_MR7G005486 [Morella rubra]
MDVHILPQTPNYRGRSVVHSRLNNSQQNFTNMVESFFSLRRTDLLDHNQSDPIVLLSGPPSCGKTSLLFQFAFNSALDKNSKVVFICSRRKLESKPPYLSQGIDPSSDTFERIQMKYVNDDEGIKSYFAAFHLYDTFPTAVVVDDFGDFFEERSCRERYNNPRGRHLAMVRTLALCHNALIHANKTGPCKLLLSDTHLGDSPRLLFIYKRWVPTIFTIKGDGLGSFLLKSYSTGSGSSERIRTAKYSIALQYLNLEGITEDGDRVVCHRRYSGWGTLEILCLGTDLHAVQWVLREAMYKVAYNFGRLCEVGSHSRIVGCKPSNISNQVGQWLQA